MLLLAGLMGMMAVSAAALWGLEDLGAEKDGDPDLETPGEGDMVSADGGGDGQSIMDIATQDDPADPEGDDWTVQEGTVTADTMTGTAINDFLSGQGGNDTVDGLSGTDALRGGDGDDLLRGGEGDDSLHGEAGQDTLQGEAGADSLYGHGGDDVLSGGDGGDSLTGGQGDDTLHGGAGADALHGYMGSDSLNGDAGEDTLFGGYGADTLDGRTAEGDSRAEDSDYLNGGQDDDVIFAGGGDVVTGGSGSDEIVLGDWLNSDHQAEVLDFSTEEDSLVVFYDEATNPDPDVTVEPDAEDDTLHHVLMDGVAIAQVHSATALSVDHIALVPQAEETPVA